MSKTQPMADSREMILVHDMFRVWPRLLDRIERVDEAGVLDRQAAG